MENGEIVPGEGEVAALPDDGGGVGVGEAPVPGTLDSLKASIQADILGSFLQEDAPVIQLDGELDFSGGYGNYKC